MSRVKNEPVGWKICTWMLLIVFLIFVFCSNEISDTDEIKPKVIHDTFNVVDTTVVHDTIIRWYEKKAEEPAEDNNEVMSAPDFE